MTGSPVLTIILLALPCATLVIRKLSQNQADISNTEAITKQVAIRMNAPSAPARAGDLRKAYIAGRNKENPPGDE